MVLPTTEGTDMARKAREDETRMRADYLLYAENMEARAEQDTNGVLWNARGRAARDAGTLRQWDLFTRQWPHVAPYASEELTEWFALNGRMTFTEYRSQIRACQREAYEAYLDSITEVG